MTLASDLASAQTGAVSLKRAGDPDGLNRVAGLEFIVDGTAAQWPILHCKGGVALDGGTIIASANSLPVTGVVSHDFRTIATSVLGAISIPGDSPPSITETATWDHVKLSYASEFDLTLSRLTPATLIETSKTSLRLCGGTVPTKRVTSAGSITETTTQEIKPKWVAWHTSGGYQVATIASGPSLAGMDQPWLLVWFGSQSHWVDTTLPISYSHDIAQGYQAMPQRYAFQADCPLLLVFSANPTAIVYTSGQGGFDLTLPAGAKKISTFPLYGRARQVAGATDTWNSGANLAAGAKTLIQAWYPRLQMFPATAVRTHAYTSDTATITETFTWTTVLSSGASKFAPLPPFVGVARNTEMAGIGVSGAVVDGLVPTEYGPLQGVVGVDTFDWTVTGLAQYTTARAAPGAGTIPTAFQTALNAAVDALIAQAHWRPWYFHTRGPQDAIAGDVYFSNPADTLAMVAEIIPLVSGARKTSLIAWLVAEHGAHNPETVYHLDGTETGTDRGLMSIPASQGDTWYTSHNSTVFSARQWLWSAWALARYYQETGASLSGLTIATNLYGLLTSDMAEQDWATLHWFAAQGDRQTSVENANRHWAGLAGLAWLMAQKSDTNEGTVRALFAEATIARVAMAHLPRWQAAQGLITLPTDIVSAGLGASNAEWLPKLANNWQGFVYTYDWTDANDDPRQVIRCNQFQAFLDDSNARGGWNVGEDYAYVPPYRSFVRPLATLLKGAVGDAAVIYAAKTEELRPHWWVPYADSWLGEEQGLMHPADNLGLFLAHAWLMGTAPALLGRYAAYPWLVAS